VTDGLGLDAAGIAHDADGIRLGKDLRTSNRRVYAIGDAAGTWQLTALANHHAGLVLRAILFRLPIRATLARVPRVLFTDPECAELGVGPAAAGPDMRLLRWSFHQNDRATIEGRGTGFVTLVTTRRGRLLGATLVGPNATEMIALVALALAK